MKLEQTHRNRRTGLFDALTDYANWHKEERGERGIRKTAADDTPTFFLERPLARRPAADGGRARGEGTIPKGKKGEVKGGRMRTGKNGSFSFIPIVVAR